MLQLPIYLLAIACVFINTSYGQFDYKLCPDGPTPNIVDADWQPVPSRFEVVTELVSGKEVWELSQAFSQTRDSLMITTAKGPMQFYFYFDTNELFQVVAAVINQQEVLKCFREPLTSQSETSVIQPKTLYIKPSILLGYNSRNQKNSAWGIRYDSDGVLRGMPTNIFKSCFYVNDTQATVSATYHVADAKKLIAYLPLNRSIPLQIEVTTTRQNSPPESFVYNIFHYSPNPRPGEERQALETPVGVFCPNRTRGLGVPENIPDASSANAEIFGTNLNSSIISTKNFYDTNAQFTLFDAWFPDSSDGSRWVHMTEIHDFAVGLSYRYLHSSYQCTVSDIQVDGTDAVSVDGNPNLIQFGNPQHIFLLDDMDYRYTGERRCRDRIMCHVWIGEKNMPNNTVQHREWYWASSINGEPLKEWIPTKLIIKQSLNDFPLFNFEINIFDFRRRPSTLIEVDFTLANCYRALGPSANYNLAVLSFRINNDKNYPVLQNLNYLRRYIFETLLFAMFVRPIRVSNLLVDRISNDILVTFTLLDAPPRTGPVENPLKESSLDKAIERLSSAIDSNNLVFRARYDNKQTVLYARPGSLNVNHRSAVTKTISTGPTITGLWIGLILVGIVIGGVGGFFVLSARANK